MARAARSAEAAGRADRLAPSVHTAACAATCDGGKLPARQGQRAVVPHLAVVAHGGHSSYSASSSGRATSPPPSPQEARAWTSLHHGALPSGQVLPSTPSTARRRSPRRRVRRPGRGRPASRGHQRAPGPSTSTTSDMEHARPPRRSLVLERHPGRQDRVDVEHEDSSTPRAARPRAACSLDADGNPAKATSFWATRTPRSSRSRTRTTRPAPRSTRRSSRCPTSPPGHRQPRHGGGAPGEFDLLLRR